MIFLLWISDYFFFYPYELNSLFDVFLNLSNLLQDWLLSVTQVTVKPKNRVMMGNFTNVEWKLVQQTENVSNSLEVNTSDIFCKFIVLRDIYRITLSFCFVIFEFLKFCRGQTRKSISWMWSCVWKDVWLWCIPDFSRWMQGIWS